jgi:tetratricopeptide (TPR) repeat protein
MMKDEEIIRQQALILFERAYRQQMNGAYGNAILLYERSLEIHPTAEAYTFLGWTYSMLSHYQTAIEACYKAIELDPDYGNPYNDIGSYLIELERWEEAIPWLEKAIVAARYDSPQYPHMNLGRVYGYLGDFQSALAYYNQALEIDPIYLPATWAKYQLVAKLN